MSEIKCAECGERLTDGELSGASVAICSEHLGTGTARELMARMRDLCDKYLTDVSTRARYVPPPEPSGPAEVELHTALESPLPTTARSGPPMQTAGRVVQAVKRTSTSWRPALRGGRSG